MKSYLLAHDLGTSGNKATVFSLDGRLVRSVTESYETRYFNGNWAEQEPADWWKAVVSSTRRVMEGIPAGEIAAIGLSGQMMGCVCVDARGEPLRPALLYCDQRAQKEQDEILEKVSSDEGYRITGHRISASYSAEKLMWVRHHEPETYRKTAKMLHAKDWINFKLTGVMRSEFSDASGTNLLELDTLRWSPQLIEASGLDSDKLPELVTSTQVVGEVTSAAAQALGLVVGIPVVAGAGDGVCAGVGVGSVAPGKTYNYLGSSSWIATTSPVPVYDKLQRTFTWAHAVPGQYHPCGTMQTAGSSYAWVRNTLGTLEKAASSLGIDAYELLNAQISRSPPGANGLVFLPYLLGERTPRWNPAAKGALIGLTLSHGRDDVLRSVLEGITLNLSVILEIFRTTMDIRSLVVIGGGAKGAVWRQIMADIYEAEVLTPSYLEEATSMGAAILAGIGCGAFRDFSAVDRFFQIKAQSQPDPATFETYRALRRNFDDCYDALEPLFGRLGVPPAGRPS